MLKYTAVLLLSLASVYAMADNFEEDSSGLQPNVESLEQDKGPVEILTIGSDTVITQLPHSLKSTLFSYDFSNNMNTVANRVRNEADSFEMTCLVKQATAKSAPNSISCISETKDQTSITLTSGTKLMADFKPSSDIDMVELDPGLKLVSFQFDMDGTKITTTSTKHMLNTDKPEIYALFRFSDSGNSWSGKRLMFIREHR